MAVLHRLLRRASLGFAFMANAAVLLIGPGGLRKRQKLAGRLADALSELYLMACALKRFEDDGEPPDDRSIVTFAARNGFFRIQEALGGAIANFPVTWARPLLGAIVLPLGRSHRPASDALGHRVVQLALQPGPTRDRLTRDIYHSDNPDDPVGLLDVALGRVVLAEAAQKKLDRWVRRGKNRRRYGVELIAEGLAKGIVNDAEAALLRSAEEVTARAVAVDDFDPDEIRPNYMTAGHNTLSMRGLAKSEPHCDRRNINDLSDGSAARDG